MQWRFSSLVKPFRAPRKTLGNLDADAASGLIAAATDLAVVLDEKGVIRDLSFQDEEMSLELDAATWLGERWVDTVTVESRPKVEQLIKQAASKTMARWRQVNHPSPRGIDVPVLYSAVPLGEDGRIIAFGRDLRAISTLQQQLVDAQQSLERDYSRLRQVETRYRLLFQMSSEPVLMVDAMSLRIVEANPAAVQLVDLSTGRLQGGAFPDLFEADSVGSVQGLLAAARTAGRAEDIRAKLGGTGREVSVSASLFRQENVSLFLARLSPVRAEAQIISLPKPKSRLLSVVENAPDGFVVTGTDGRIVSVNAAFLEMAELASEDQVRDESLDRWVGRPGVDLQVLLANLKQRGSVRLFSTILRGEYGGSAEVEISAVSVVNADQPCYGFAIRNIGRRLPTVDSRTAREVPRSVEQLTELIGRVSLKDLVRESTDMIERLCIEAALQLTGDNRASAAEMLGLSRQSLYVKLRRYGLGDLSSESEASETAE